MAAPLVYDPYAYEIHEDPYPTYTRLRDEAPAYYNPDARLLGAVPVPRRVERDPGLGDVLVGRGRVARARLRDPAADDHRHGPAAAAEAAPAGLEGVHAAAHRGSSSRRSAALTRKYLEPLLARGACDFIQDFAAKLPMDVISTMMGVPEADQDMLRGWADTLLHREEGKSEIPKAGLEASGKLARYFAEDLARRRAATPATT